MSFRVPRRKTLLGQSFTTCLLVVVLFFGGLGTYYFKVFRWRHLEDPKYDLLIVEKTDSAEIAFFRVKTVPTHLDPAAQQLTKLKDLRKKTKKGTVKPDNFDQSMKEIGTRLIEIMNDAKLRQIPKQYEKRYTEILVGISEIYRGWRSLQESVSETEPVLKEKAFKESGDWIVKAERRFKTQRPFFHAGT